MFANSLHEEYAHKVLKAFLLYFTQNVAVFCYYVKLEDRITKNLLNFLIFLKGFSIAPYATTYCQAKLHCFIPTAGLFIVKFINLYEFVLLLIAYDNRINQ